jgi:hypothetical protein
VCHTAGRQIRFPLRVRTGFNATQAVIKAQAVGVTPDRALFGGGGFRGIGTASLSQSESRVMIQLTVRKIGDVLGVLLPAGTWDVAEGDIVVVRKSSGGSGAAISDDEIDRLMTLAEGAMATRRKVLRALSK